MLLIKIKVLKWQKKHIGGQYSLVDILVIVRVIDYTNYAEILIEKSKSDEHGRVSLRAANYAVTILENLNNLYNSDRIVQAQANIMLIFAYQTINKVDKSRVNSEKSS